MDTQFEMAVIEFSIKRQSAPLEIMEYVKIINCLSNSEDKIFENEEIKLLLSAMNIIPGKYNSSKLRYGRIAICSDAD